MADYEFQCPACDCTTLIEKTIGEKLDGFSCKECRRWLTTNGGLAVFRETTPTTRIKTHDQLLEWLSFVKQAMTAAIVALATTAP